MDYMRHYPLENIQNCRDLGGYPIEGGGVTKFGRLLRCGTPRRPSEADMQFISDYGIKSVFDLRGDMETISVPSAFREAGLEYHHLSLLEINPAMPHMNMSIEETYITSLSQSRGNFAALFSMLSRAEKPSLFHCFLGKDRTGMTAALILYLTGVCFEDIVADYKVSSTYLYPFYRREIEMETGLIWDNGDDHLSSKSETIITVFDYLKRRFGSVEDYFLSSGVTEQELEAVGNILK